MNIPGLVTGRMAEAAIAGHRILITGAAVGGTKQAVGVAAPMIGVSPKIPAAAGAITDVIRSGIAPVEYGGTVADGALMTSDAQGRAIAVTLPVSVATYTIGFSEGGGVVGDIGSVNIVPGFIPAP